MPSNRRMGNGGNESRYGTLNAKTNGGAVCWGDVDPGAISVAIDRCTNSGDLVMFSRTIDGGALSLRIKSGEQTDKWYFITADDAYEAIKAIIAIAEA